MKKVLMALVVAGFMAGPVFADIDVNTPLASGMTTLVYQVSGSMKGWEFLTADANFAFADKVKLKSYVVFGVDDLTLETIEQADPSEDPNAAFLNNTALIVLGSTANIKKALAVVRNSDFSDANTVVMDLATGEQPVFTKVKGSHTSITITSTKMVDATFFAFGDLFDVFTATSMFGKLSNVSLPDKKIMLPKSLRAAGELETFDPDSFFEEDDLPGTLKFKLNTSYTKKVDTFTVGAATLFIVADLVDKGYAVVGINDIILAE
jgi:hypothetical protein